MPDENGKYVDGAEKRSLAPLSKYARAIRVEIRLARRVVLQRPGQFLDRVNLLIYAAACGTMSQNLPGQANQALRHRVVVCTAF